MSDTDHTGDSVDTHDSTGDRNLCLPQAQTDWPNEGVKLKEIKDEDDYVSDNHNGRYTYKHSNATVENYVKSDSEFMNTCVQHNYVTGDDKRAFDSHGFIIFPPDRQVDAERDHNLRVKPFTSEQLKKVEVFLEEWNESTSRLSLKLQSFLYRGFPWQHRASLWKKLLEIETLKAWTDFVYEDEVCHVREQLVDLGISEYGSGSDTVTFLCDVECHEAVRVKYGQISLEALRHIILDLDRTYPTHQRYTQPEGRAALFRVLAVYARFNRDVEYCQGMASIAGMLLMYMPEDDTFWCLVSMLERHKYLVGYFSNSMHRLRIHGAVFERLLKQRYPKLSSHMHVCGVDPLMYLTPWFLSIYTGWPCWETVLTAWDLLLLEGNKALFRVALTVIDILHDSLLDEEDISTLLPRLLHMQPDVCRFDVFVSRLAHIVVEDWEVNSIVGIMDEEESLPRKRRHAGDNSKPCKRRRFTSSTTECHTPERSGLLKKFTSMFTSNIYTSPVAVNDKQAVSNSTTGRLSHRSLTRTPLQNLNVTQKCYSGKAMKYATPRSNNKNAPKRLTPKSTNSKRGAKLLTGKKVVKCLIPRDNNIQKTRKYIDTKTMLPRQLCVLHPLSDGLTTTPQFVASPVLVKHLRNVTKRAAGQCKVLFMKKEVVSKEGGVTLVEDVKIEEGKINVGQVEQKRNKAEEVLKNKERKIILSEEKGIVTENDQFELNLLMGGKKLAEGSSIVEGKDELVDLNNVLSPEKGLFNSSNKTSALTDRALSQDVMLSSESDVFSSEIKISMEDKVSENESLDLENRANEWRSPFEQNMGHSSQTRRLIMPDLNALDSPEYLMHHQHQPSSDRLALQQFQLPGHIPLPSAHLFSPEIELQPLGTRAASIFKTYTPDSDMQEVTDTARQLLHGEQTE